MAGAAPLVLLAVLAIAVLWFQYAANKRRQQSCIAVAQQLGFSYHSHDPFDMLRLPFDAFERGHSQEITNVLVGRGGDGMEVRVFDFEYVVGSGKSRTTYYRCCVLSQTRGYTPHLLIDTENLLTRAGRFVGVRDIELESEEFNDAFHVRSDDARFATTLLDPQMMQHLLRSGIDDAVEVGGPWLLDVSTRVEPARFPQLLARTAALQSRIPSLVWDLYPGSSASR